MNDVQHEDKLLNRFKALSALAAEDSGATKDERLSAEMRMEEMVRRYPDIFDELEGEKEVRIKIAKSISSGMISITILEKDIFSHGGMTIPNTTSLAIAMTFIQRNFHIVLHKKEIECLIQNLK